MSMTTRTRRPAAVAVGTDGSYWGNAALRWAAVYARSTTLALDVAVADPRRERLPRDVPFDLGISDVLGSFPSVPVCRHQCADPVVDLLAASTVHPLTVVGYRGHRRTMLGLGHCAARLAEAGAHDVVIVRGRPTTELGRIRSITAVAHDEYEEASVLLRAKELATTWHARVHLIRHVSNASAIDAVSHIGPSDLLVIARATVPAPLHDSLLVRAALYHAPCPVLLTSGG
jgi:hypothetical protein